MIDRATFFRKVKDINQLKDLTAKSEVGKSKFIITKYIELNDKNFKCFCEDFYEHQEFIINNMIHMGLENDTYSCLLVYSKHSSYGILVECEGYSYARYTALVNMNEVAR